MKSPLSCEAIRLYTRREPSVSAEHMGEKLRELEHRAVREDSATDGVIGLDGPTCGIPRADSGLPLTKRVTIAYGPPY